MKEAYEGKQDLLNEWFKAGMKVALLAPTGMNQQKFMIKLDNNKVSAVATGKGYANIDLGIVKYHFEVAAGKENFNWA